MKTLARFTKALIAFGPLGFLMLTLIDSLGVPLPGAVDIFLVTFAAEEPQRAYLAALAAVIGSSVGNLVLFQASCHGSKLFVKDGPTSARGQKFQEWFHRYGLVTVFIPAVTPIVPFPLKVFVMSAGCLRTHFGKFMAVVLVARVIRYFGLAFLGAQLGKHAESFLRRNAWSLLGAAVALSMAVYFLVRYSERRSAQVPPIA